MSSKLVNPLLIQAVESAKSIKCRTAFIARNLDGDVVPMAIETPAYRPGDKTDDGTVAPTSLKEGNSKTKHKRNMGEISPSVAEKIADSLASGIVGFTSTGKPKQGYFLPDAKGNAKKDKGKEDAKEDVKEETATVK